MTNQSTTKDTRPQEIEIIEEPTISAASSVVDPKDVDIEAAATSAKHTEIKTSTRSPSYAPVLAACVVIACAIIIPTAFYYAHSKENKEVANKPALLPSPSSVVVFGDSFSDTGNVYAASNQTIPETPPYWKGRYSDGRNYVDFLQEQLGTKTTIQNYAWGGATTDSTLIAGYSTFLDGPVPSVNDQVSSFLQEPVPSETNSTLYVLYSGYNDYWWWVYNNLANSSAEVTMDQMDAFADNVTTSLVDSMETLINGSQLHEHQFLISNLPPMVDFPEAANYSTTKHQAYRYLTERHNQLLLEKLNALQTTADLEDTTIKLLDVHSLYSDALDNPTQQGFDPVEDGPKACLSQDDNVCDDPFGHIFWDLYHPTTHFHFLIFKEVVKLIGV